MIKDIQRIIELEKARKIYENRIDSCYEGQHHAINLYRRNLEYRDKLVNKYEALINRYNEILNAINEAQKRVEDNLILQGRAWNKDAYNLILQGRPWNKEADNEQ